MRKMRANNSFLEARETVSPLAQLRPTTAGGQQRGVGPRPRSIELSATVAHQDRVATVGKRYGKGMIVGVGRSIFEHDHVEWVHRPSCKTSGCATPNAHHFLRQRGNMKGYCINCISSIMDAEERRSRAAFASRTRTQLAGTKFGKGMVISTGVDDGPWTVEPRCVAPRCKTAYAKPYLVKKSGHWKGHCTLCIAAHVEAGEPPYPLPPPAREEWRTRSIPGLSNASVHAHIAMRVGVVLTQLEATPSFRVPPRDAAGQLQDPRADAHLDEMLRFSPPPPSDDVVDVAAALDASSVGSVTFAASSDDESSSDVDSDLMMNL